MFRFNFSHMNFQHSSTIYWKIILHLIIFVPFGKIKNSWLYLYGSISELSVLFYISMCLFFYQYHTILFTVATPGVCVFQGRELLIVCLYYHFNVHGIRSNDPSFISDMGNLCPFFFSLVSLARDLLMLLVFSKH